MKGELCCFHPPDRPSSCPPVLPSSCPPVLSQIAMGCVTPERPADRQVHIQYSVDFGVTWKYLVPQCLPADPRCGGQVSQPSVFFPADGWKRAVYTLPDSLADTYAGPTLVLIQAFMCSLHARAYRLGLFNRIDN